MQNKEAFERVRAIGFSFDHVDYFLLELFALGVPVGPVVASTASLLGDEDVLRVVQVCVGPVLDAIDDLNSRGKYSRLQVDQDGSGHVVVIISLVEENILPVLHLAVYRVLFQDP